MSEEKKNPPRPYRFGGIIYPESESYDCNEVIAEIKEYFDQWAFITHDRDLNEDGEIKKTHIHWYGKSADGKTLSAVSKRLKVAQNHIEVIDRPKGWLRYFIHLDDPDKAPYAPEEVTYSANLDYLSLVQRHEGAQAFDIMDYIISENITSTKELATWAMKNGCWSEFRRCFAIWSCIMRENRTETSENHVVELLEHNKEYIKEVVQECLKS